MNARFTAGVLPHGNVVLEQVERLIADIATLRIELERRGMSPSAAQQPLRKLRALSHKLMRNAVPDGPGLRG